MAYSECTASRRIIVIGKFCHSVDHSLAINSCIITAVTAHCQQLRRDVCIADIVNSMRHVSRPGLELLSFVCPLQNVYNVRSLAFVVVELLFLRSKRQDITNLCTADCSSHSLLRDHSNVSMSKRQWAVGTVFYQQTQCYL